MNTRLFSFLGFFLLSQFCFAQEDSLKIKKTKIAVYPAIGYTPETKFNLGAIGFIVIDKEDKNQEYYRPTSITPLISFTTNKQVLIKSDFDIYFNNGINLNMEARYFNFPDFYFGIGNGTDPNVSATYTDKFGRFAGRITKPFSSKLYAGLLFDFQFNHIKSVEEGGLLDVENPTGIEGGFNMGMGPGFIYDSRNSTLYPTDGRFVQAGMTIYGKVFGSEYGYTNYLFDYRQYFEFLSPKNVLAFQFKMNMTSGSETPFYKLNPLGGGGRMRGIAHRNLYKDRQSIYFQVEGRQELFWRLGGVIFAGVGEVFDSFAEIKKEDVRFVYGFGGRFKAIKGEKLNVRLDVGFTDNGQHAFYLSVREAF